MNRNRFLLNLTVNKRHCAFLHLKMGSGASKVGGRVATLSPTGKSEGPLVLVLAAPADQAVAQRIVQAALARGLAAAPAHGRKKHHKNLTVTHF